MTEKNLPTLKETPIPDKDVLILAGGVIDKKEYHKSLNDLLEKKKGDIVNIHAKTHTDITALRLQEYENRDMPSTYMDDAFRAIMQYGNMEHMPRHFMINQNQIHDLTYEMLRATQENIPGGLTKEDIGNIGQGSIENFILILQSVGVTKEGIEQQMRESQVFGRQLARTLLEKRKIPKK